MDIDTSMKFGEIIAKTESQQKSIDDHEKRIRDLEDFNSIVKELTRNVEKQGDNIDKMASTMSTMKETIDNINFALKESELKQKYGFYIKLRNMIKKLNIKKIVIYILGGTGAGSIVKFVVDLFK